MIPESFARTGLEPETRGVVLRMLACGICAVVLGCSTTHYKASADRDAYSLVREKTPQVPGMLPDFTIDRDLAGLGEELPAVTEKKESLGEAAEAEVGSKILTLELALAIAVRNSREYQDQKEALYLSALDLALSRHRYDPIFALGGSADYRRSTRDITKVSNTAELARAAPEFVRQISELTGTPGALAQRYSQLVESAATVTGLNASRVEIADERSVDGSTGAGVDLLLAGGARIALDLTSNFLRFLTGDPRVTTSSALTATLTQPLLRGAGRKIALENLTQAERSFLYQLRSFVRFRQQFSVDIASSYYRVLQSRDGVQNNWQLLDGQRKDAARQRALADAGRLAKTELGRTLQSELQAESSWIAAVQRYKRDLDEYKIELGLSTDTKVVLDDQELVLLMERGLIQPKIAPEDAAKVALAARLDLYNSRDQVEDAGRKVKVAANALKPGLDLVMAGRVDSEPGADEFQNLDFQRAQWNAGLDLELPVERKAERNAYREALITQDRSERQLQLFEDEIKLAVRQSVRDLEQSERNFEIRKIGVELNERRVRELDLRFQKGEARALDRIDAQNDLSDSRNALTAALVDHTISRLRLWLDMGILFIKEDGKWEEVTDGEYS